MAKVIITIEVPDDFDAEDIGEVVLRHVSTHTPKNQLVFDGNDWDDILNQIQEEDIDHE